jgi:EmrB/QacA subfamily drug resistance transporter
MTQIKDDVAAPTGASMTHRQILEALSGLLLGMFMAMLSAMIVSNALPRIVTELHGSQSGYTWVVTGGLLATTATTPIWGKLADLTSKKLLIQLAMLIFLAGSVLSGLAQSTGELIAFRVIQGVGAGGHIALSQVILAVMISPRERGRYMGYLGAVMAAATISGPLIGGVIVDTPWLGWRWCFYIAVPFGLLAMATLHRTLHLPNTTRKAKIDYLGATVITAAVSLILIWVTFAGNRFPWLSWQTTVMVGGTLVLTVLAVVIESRAAEPMIPLTLFRSRTVTLATLASVAVGLVMFGTALFLGLYFQIGRGQSPTVAGLMSLPIVLGQVLSATVVGRLITRTGRWKRYLLGGSIILTLGTALMSTIDADTSIALLCGYMALIGTGIGATMQNLVLAVQNVVDPRELGAASSAVTFFRSLGGATGVSVLGAVLANRASEYLAAGLAKLGIPAPTTSGGGGAIPDVRELPAPIRAVVETAYADAVADIFLVAVPFTLVAVVTIALIREVPLSRLAAIDLLKKEATAPAGSGTSGGKSG